MDSCLSLKIWVKVLVKLKAKVQTVNTVKNFLIMLNKKFKTSSKRVIQKTAEAAGDIIGNKNADKMTRISKLHPRIILIQMKKYLKKNMHLQK